MVQILAQPRASEESVSTCAPPQPLCNSCNTTPDPSTPIMSSTTDQHLLGPYLEAVLAT